MIGGFCALDEEYASETEPPCKRFSYLTSCAFGASARKMAREVILLEEICQLRAIGHEALQTALSPANENGTVINSAVLSASPNEAAVSKRGVFSEII